MSSLLISLGKPYQFLVITASFSKFWGEKSTHIYTDTDAHIYMGFPDGSDGKESACNAGVTRKDPLEKGKATHSRILAWRIPWTEDPGGLQSKGSQRVRHN